MHKLFKSRVAAVATGALVVVGLGATGATAAGLVGSDDIRNNSIQSQDINDNTIQAQDVQRDAIGTAELAPQAVGTRILENGGVNLEDLSDRARTALEDSTQVSGLRQDVDALGVRVGSMEEQLAAGYVGANWGIIDRNVIGAGDAFLRPGPTSAAFSTTVLSPPAGVGSLGIRTASATDKVAFGNQVDLVGDSVQALNNLSYSVFTTGENNALGNNMPSIAFEIDPNLDPAVSTSNYSSMVFAPANSAANEWTTIDATDDAQGKVWGLTGGAGTATGCALSGARCTWTELQQALGGPDDTDPATIYTVAISKGRDYAFSGAVDALRINDQVFDFEPLGVETQTVQ